MNLRNKLPGMYGWGLTVDNVNEALPMGLDLIKKHGKTVVSRGIETLEVPGPVSTIYRTPMRRVLFDDVRDANPFFHFMESLWILGGGKTVHLPKLFLNTIGQFSDDEETFHGAYGDRLRNWPDETINNDGMDQIIQVINLLREKPDTRQAVMSIWNPAQDLGTPTKDMPCNDMIMFQARDGYLHMTVCNRSNDAIWGAYGANAVQFSMLHEVIAVASGLEVGYYVQQSNSYHIYPSNPFWQQYLAGNYARGEVHNPYMLPDFQPWPVASSAPEAMALLDDCWDLVQLVGKDTTYADIVNTEWTTPLFKEVVVPMVYGYGHYKDGDYEGAVQGLSHIAADDWRAACMAWVMRRRDKAVTV